MLFGDRSHTWPDEAACSQFAGLEEPFAVVHKAMLHIFLKERNKDAAPRAKPRRSAAHVYQRVQNLVQRIASERWRAAWATRHRDGGAAVAQFRKRWEAPGLAVVLKSEGNARVTMFMRDAARERWRERACAGGARRHRYQQHAPPTRLPPETRSCYIDGDAEARKKDMPPPPAGWGCIVMTGGHGHDHARGRMIFRLGGQIVAHLTPNVSTTTGNLACLVACVSALRWAIHDPEARGRPVCIRYESEYAANICSGVWRAKKHQAVAAEGRALWRQLKQISGGKLWLHHCGNKSKGTTYIQQAHALAIQGRTTGRTVHERVA